MEEGEGLEPKLLPREKEEGEAICKSIFASKVTPNLLHPLFLPTASPSHGEVSGENLDLVSFFNHLKRPQSLEYQGITGFQGHQKNCGHFMAIL